MIVRRSRKISLSSLRIRRAIRPAFAAAVPGWAIRRILAAGGVSAGPTLASLRNISTRVWQPVAVGARRGFPRRQLTGAAAKPIAQPFGSSSRCVVKMTALPLRANVVDKLAYNLAPSNRVQVSVHRAGGLAVDESESRARLTRCFWPVLT